MIMMTMTTILTPMSAQLPPTAVLAWGRVLVVKELHKVVVSSRDTRTQEWTDPVDPVVRLEVSSRDAGPEGARGVEGGAGVEDASDFGDEEGEADADWGDEGAFVFFHGEHEDCEDEECC